MAYWNFTHYVLHMHMWMLPALITGAVMAVSGLVHSKRQKDRRKKYNEELQEAVSEQKEAGV